MAIENLPTTTPGAAWEFARTSARHADIPYIKLWMGIIVLLLNTQLMLYINVMGNGWMNVFPFIIGLLVIMIAGFMPLWLIAASFLGGVHSATHDRNNIMGGMVGGASMWVKKVVATTIVAYAFLGLILIPIPFGNFPLAYYAIEIVVVIYLFAGIAFGKSTGGNGYKVITGVAMLTLVLAIFGLLPDNFVSKAKEVLPSRVNCMMDSSRSSCKGYTSDDAGVTRQASVTIKGKQLFLNARTDGGMETTPFTVGAKKVTVPIANQQCLYIGKNAESVEAVGTDGAIDNSFAAYLISKDGSKIETTAIYYSYTDKHCDFMRS